MGKSLSMFPIKGQQTEGHSTFSLLAFNDGGSAEARQAQTGQMGKQDLQDFSMEAISATDIVDTISNGLLVLDTSLTIASANRNFYSTFHTTPERTIGQRLFDLGNGQWDIPELRHLLERLIPENKVVEGYEIEHEFPDIGLKSMLLSARKVYRPGNDVEFFLLVIEDVTELRAQQREAERNFRLAQNIVDTIRDPLVILESDMTVVTASRAFLRLFDASADRVVGRSLRSLGQGQWDVTALTRLLDRVLPDNQAVDDFLLEDEFPGLGRRVFKINARKIFRPGNHVTRLLVVFEDATDAILLDRHREMLAGELAHRIKNNLQVISAFVAFELRRAAEPCRNGYRAMQTRIGAVAELYDVIAHSSALGPVSMPDYLDGIAKSIRSSLLDVDSDIRIHIDAEPLSIQSDHAVPLGLIVNELSTNAIKHAFPAGKGELTMGFRLRDGEAVMTVHDNGVGITPAGESSGLGSRFVDAFVKQIGGTMAVGSGSNGTTVTVRLPKSILADS